MLQASETISPKCYLNLLCQVTFVVTFLPICFLLNFQVLATGVSAILHVRGLAGRDTHLPQLLFSRWSSQRIFLNVLHHYVSLEETFLHH